jgi:hypothetical protein
VTEQQCPTCGASVAVRGDGATKWYVPGGITLTREQAAAVAEAVEEIADQLGVDGNRRFERFYPVVDAIRAQLDQQP